MEVKETKKEIELKLDHKIFLGNTDNLRTKWGYDLLINQMIAIHERVEMYAIANKG